MVNAMKALRWLGREFHGAVSYFLLLLLVFCWSCVSAQGQSSVGDINGDGKVSVLTFGDSITYGVGDGLSPGSFVEEIPDIGAANGYPARISAAMGLDVANAGLPGERLLTGGIYRLPSLVVGSDVDVVVIMEGANDAINRVESREYRIALQRLINVVLADGRNVVLATLPPPAASRRSLALYTSLYSSIIRELGAINSVAVAEVEQKFVTECPDLDMCSLYNIPEGLHPNTAGYDAIAEVMQVALGGN